MGAKCGHDLKSLIEETVLALEHLDADALERILAGADAFRSGELEGCDLRESVPARGVLQELLRATRRNIDLLWSLQSSGARTKGPNEHGPRQTGTGLAGYPGYSKYSGYGDKFEQSLRRSQTWQR